MYYINGLTSKGYNYVSHALSQIIPHNDTGTIAGKVTQVAKGVFNGLAPYVIEISPLYLSRMINLRFLGVMGLLEVAVYQALETHTSWLGTARGCVLAAASLIGTADLLGYTPLEKEYRIAVDSLLLLATAIGSSRAVFEGTRRMLSDWNAEGISTTSKVSNFVSGAVLTTIGTFGMCSAVTMGFKLERALRLSPEKLALKQRSYGFLESKDCNAVIFDGMNGGNDLTSKAPAPFSETLYENCNTISYDPRDSKELCDALADSKARLGSIDVVAFSSHATNEAHYFNNGYVFEAETVETDCMNNALSDDAQVFLVGCNTATSNPKGGLTLTEKVSKSLPGKEVTGFSGYYAPFYSSTSFSNGRFQHENYYPANQYGFNFPKTAVVQKS